MHGEPAPGAQKGLEVVLRHRRHNGGMDRTTVKPGEAAAQSPVVEASVGNAKAWKEDEDKAMDVEFVGTPKLSDTQTDTRTGARGSKNRGKSGR